MESKLSNSQQRNQSSISNVVSDNRRVSFIASRKRVVHQHSHRSSPHVHSGECDRFLSGIDRNRHLRYYFTNEPTPVRVYLTYSLTGLTDSKQPNATPLPSEMTLTNRKLSPRLYRNQYRLNPRYADEMKNYVFNKETLSFVPLSLGISATVDDSTCNNNGMTFAEMAVMCNESSTGPVKAVPEITVTKKSKKFV